MFYVQVQVPPLKFVGHRCPTETPKVDDLPCWKQTAATIERNQKTCSSETSNVDLFIFRKIPVATCFNDRRILDCLQEFCMHISIRLNIQQYLKNPQAVKWSRDSFRWFTAMHLPEYPQLTPTKLLQYFGIVIQKHLPRRFWHRKGPIMKNRVTSPTVPNM